MFGLHVAIVVSTAVIAKNHIKYLNRLVAVGFMGLVLCELSVAYAGSMASSRVRNCACIGLCFSLHNSLFEKLAETLGYSDYIKRVVEMWAIFSEFNGRL
jgi:hypothetical protein